MTTLAQSRTAVAGAGEAPAAIGTRRLLLLLAATLVWVIAWYGETAANMVDIWIRAETYTHGFIIAPISIWLVWRNRADLAGVPVRPAFWVLVPLAGAGFTWLVGSLAGGAALQQFALVAMIVLAIWTVVGTAIVRRLAFPLGFLFFSVPFGEFLMPVLMRHTADFTVWAISMSGIPVYREGLFFTLPTGRWSVVEACSGLRYLIASVTLGCLYGYLTYRSLARRWVFVVVSVIVPIVANWLRAYMIVMIGHLSGMKLAVGVDHLVYGWVFFGIVMGALFWIGSYWREDLDAPQSAAGALVPAPEAPARTGALLAAALAVAIVAAVWPRYDAHLDDTVLSTAVDLRVPGSIGDWTTGQRQGIDWAPTYHGSRQSAERTYVRGPSGVTVRVDFYVRQREGAELIMTANQLVVSGQSWTILREGVSGRPAGAGFAPRTSVIRGSRGDILVWDWYWVDGRFTANVYEAKLRQALSRLLGRGDAAAAVTVHVPIQGSEADAAKLLEGFVPQALPVLRTALENAWKP